jgi:excisionase family DNA binding protein
MIQEGSGEPPRLALRPREAAKALGIGERLLFDLTKRGEVPHLRLGNKCVVYPLDALRDWLAGRAQRKGGDV